MPARFKKRKSASGMKYDGVQQAARHMRNKQTIKLTEQVIFALIGVHNNFISKTSRVTLLKPTIESHCTVSTGSLRSLKTLDLRYSLTRGFCITGEKRALVRCPLSDKLGTLRIHLPAIINFREIAALKTFET